MGSSSLRCNDFGTVWMDKSYLWLVHGCLEYHRPIITLFHPQWPIEGKHIITRLRSHAAKYGPDFDTKVPLSSVQSSANSLHYISWRNSFLKQHIRDHIILIIWSSIHHTIMRCAQKMRAVPHFTVQYTAWCLVFTEFMRYSFKCNNIISKIISR